MDGGVALAVSEEPTLRGAVAGVVIPAHNEAQSIGSTLSTLTEDAGPGEFEIWVICNGCTDGTEAVAATYESAGVRVVSITDRSKSRALNEGDRHAVTFPRIYLDADVTVTTESLRLVARALREGAVAASPRPVADLTGCSALVKQYFKIWARLGFATKNVLGGGMYGFSEQGRSRFGEFPEVIADDMYVYSLFSAMERVNPPGATCVQYPPRTMRALARRRTRIELGNRQVRAMLGPQGEAVPEPTWTEVVRRNPALVVAACVYASVNLLGRVRARLQASDSGGAVWSQDTTSRSPRV